MTPRWRRVVFGFLVLGGLALIASGWVMQGSDFVPSLLLELGAGLFLFAILFVLESRLGRQLSDIRRDVEQQRTSLESIRSLSRDLVGKQYTAVADLLEAWDTNLNLESVWSLLNSAQSVGAISADGIRVYLPGPDLERWMRLRAEGTSDHPRVLFAVEMADRTEEAHYEWHMDRSPHDAVRDLFEVVRRTGVEWTAFDAAWIFEQALIPIRIGLEAKYRAPRRNRDLEHVVEVPEAQWAITGRGLECTTRHYPIDWWRLWEEDWVDHMEGKGWVDIGEFITALMHARGYFESRRADAAAARAAHSPSPSPEDE